MQLYSSSIDEFISEKWLKKTAVAQECDLSRNTHSRKEE